MADPEPLRPEDESRQHMGRGAAERTPRGDHEKGLDPHPPPHLRHMLRNGAPVRHVQELLGHESLVSTQIYTRVTINDLREIHAKYHPGEAAVAESEEPGPDQVRDRIRITSDRAAEEIFSLTAFFSLSVRRFPPRARG